MSASDVIDFSVWAKCNTERIFWAVAILLSLIEQLRNSDDWKYEGWSFNSGNYLFTPDTK